MTKLRTARLRSGSNSLVSATRTLKRVSLQRTSISAKVLLKTASKVISKTALPPIALNTTKEITSQLLQKWRSRSRRSRRIRSNLMTPFEKCKAKVRARAREKEETKADRK